MKTDEDIIAILQAAPAVMEVSLTPLSAKQIRRLGDPGAERLRGKR